MSRILSANLFRLRKSRLFRWAVVLTALITAAGTLIGCLSARGELSEYAPEDYALSGAPIAAIVCAAVIILFIGADNDEHTVRNKISVGGKRKDVYSANLLTSIVIGCSINAAWLVGGLAGAPILGLWKMHPAEALVYVATSTLCTSAVSAVSALLAMVIRRRSGAAVAALTLAFALLWAASAAYNGLGGSEQEMRAEVVDGEMRFELRDNPDYVSGIRRTAYELALYSNPMGVSVALSNRDLGDPAASLAGAAFATIFVSSLGAAVFGREDLN